MSLIATDIRLAFGKTQVLHGIDFRARAGEITAIVGPNGSGKTTLLRVMVGDADASGTVLLNGHDIRRMQPWDLAAIRGVLPQASTLAFPFTVAEVVQIGLQRGARADAAARITQALARVGLAAKADRFYQELSGGEQQRVQLARVLAQVGAPLSGDGRPRWLFLDEPVSSLDIAHQIAVMDIAARFAAAGGGVVAVMHDLNLSAIYASSIAVLDAGRLLRQGAPQDVLTDAILSRAYGCPVRVGRVPPPGQIFVLPHSARA